MKAVYLEEGAVNQGDISLEPITTLLETTVYENTTEADKLEHIRDAEIVFSNKVIFDEETFRQCPRLKYIGVCATGYNVIDLEAARRHGVTVTYVPAYSTESVTQHTWGLILDCAGRISLHNDSVHRGDWVRSDTFCYWCAPVTEIFGKTIGIVGFGNIGRRVAEAAKAFGMRVLVHTAHPEKYEGTTGAAEGVTFVDLERIWAEADIISLHCPMNRDTEKMIRRETIGKMKDGVIIVNVSRGGLVDEGDLAEALKSGKVAAAAADVVSGEPMRADNPLLTAPNMIITPHIAWVSVEARERLIRIVAENVKAYLDGRPQNVLS